MLDIAIYPSVEDSESFGVAVLESSACEKPVIVSNVGGLPEVTVNGMTGYIVEPKNPEQLAKAIKKLLLDENVRKKMGKNGRKKVIEEFDWNNCVNKMVSEYKDAIGIK